MATFDTLCGYSSLANATYFYLLGEGLSPGGFYYLFFEDTPNDSYTGANGTADSSGRIVFSITSIETNYVLWLHDNISGSHAFRVASGVSVAWSSGYASPSYLGAATLSGTAGDSSTNLTWTASAVCDARADATYAIARNTFSPPSTTIAAGLTATSYHDTGLANGTTYYYRITSRLRIFGSNTSPGATAQSNIISLTPTGVVTVSLDGIAL